MNIPRVSGMFVGFYKTMDYVEFDCPWCGAVHTARIDNQNMIYPTEVAVLCQDNCRPVSIETVCVPSNYYPNEVCESEENEQD